MQGQHATQSTFFAFVYDPLVSAEHLLRRILSVADLGFVRDPIRDGCCPDNGRPSGDPLVLFTTVSWQVLCDVSDRQVEEQVNLHLAWKWFVGLQPDETGSEHTAVRRFRVCLGSEKFQGIFN